LIPFPPHAPIILLFLSSSENALLLPHATDPPKPSPTSPHSTGLKMTNTPRRDDDSNTMPLRKEFIRKHEQTLIIPPLVASRNRSLLIESAVSN
jgi:hypothetical protein